MDIRKYLQVKTQAPTKTALKAKADKDLLQKTLPVISRGSKKKTEKEKTKKSRKRIVLSDSDDEDPIPQKSAKRKIINDEDDDCIITQYNSDSNSSKKIKEAPVSKNIQKISTPPKCTKWNLETVSDFFGDAPIRRSKEVFLSKDKKKTKEANSFTENIHDDEDFEKTLLQLDEENASRKNEKLSKTIISPTQKKSRNQKSSSENKNKEPLPVAVVKSPQKESSPSPSKQEVSQPDIKQDTSLSKENKKISKTIISPNQKKPHNQKSPSEKKNKEPLPVAVIKSPQKESAPSPSKQEVSQPDIEQDTSLSKEDSAQKRKSNYLNYKKYLEREGPSALGSKDIPEGEKNCLKGLTFVITGVLESLERDQAKEIILKYGGKVTQSVSKNTSYVVVGSEPGPSKMAKVEKFETKVLNEDELLDLIAHRKGEANSPKKKKKSTPSKNTPRTSFNQNLQQSVTNRNSQLPKTSVVEVDKSKVEKDNDPNYDSDRKKTNETSPPKSQNIIIKQASEKINPSEMSYFSKSNKDSYNKNSKNEMKKNTLDQEVSEFQVKSSEIRKINSNENKFNMWVDKYKPVSTKHIIGQQGELSNANKLKKWLLNWHKNHGGGKKPSFKWGNSNDGSPFKAALLSGSPGVGKTTTAQLVCKETGFDYFELNASDKRSKRSLKEEVSEVLKNKTIADFVTGIDNKVGVTFKHTIIMDEVDGMAGNEDRGGIQELIAVIKSSKIPVICICNDRSHPKMRSLVNYCFDLRFQRPRVEQIKAAMLSVAFKEGINISPNAVQDIVVASNQDIRQVLHNLSLWCANEKKLTAEQAKADIGKGTKHIKLSPFDVLKKVFSSAEAEKMTIHDKSDLFFQDYSLGPLFVHENYVHVEPHAAKGDHCKRLHLLSAAADSICDGDIIEKQIRTGGQWSLLPVEAVFASVIPGEVMRGHLKQMIAFPSWLGKNSTRNKMDRLLQELHMHMRLRITGSKIEVNMDYMQHLKNAIAKPLILKENEGVREALNVIEYYCLLREDLESINEVSVWTGKDFMSSINSKVKAAFTRAYNKEGILTPFSVTNVKKSRKGSKEPSELLEGEDEVVEEESSNEDDDIASDAMVKIKKPAKQKKEEPIATKGKGKGGGSQKQTKKK